MWCMKGQIIMEYTYDSFIKMIILEVELFGSKVVDEEHFRLDDVNGIKIFISKYPREEGFYALMVDM